MCVTEISFDSHHQSGEKRALRSRYLKGEAVFVTGCVGLVAHVISVAARMSAGGQGDAHWGPLPMPYTAHACETGSANYTGEV